MKKSLRLFIKENRQGLDECIQYLIEALIEIKDASEHGRTSLHDAWVIRRCRDAIAKALGEDI